MIITVDGDADLLRVLSRLSTCYAKFKAAASGDLSYAPLTTLNSRVALSSALGNSCE